MRQNEDKDAANHNLCLLRNDLGVLEIWHMHLHTWCHTLLPKGNLSQNLLNLLDLQSQFYLEQMELSNDEMVQWLPHNPQSKRLGLGR